MVKNYYKILKISTNSSIDQIKSAFKGLVLYWHPKAGRKPLQAARKMFQQACQAYEVLSNQVTRGVYDMFGYDALVSGISNESEIIFPAYQYKKNSNEIYERFLLEANPFVGLIDFDGRSCNGSIFGCSFRGLQAQTDLTPINIQVSLECSLTQLYNGCSKEVTYKQRVFTASKRTTKEVKNTRKVEVTKGMANGSLITIPNAGHDSMGRQRGKLLISIVEKTDQKFTRQGNDLHLQFIFNLVEALEKNFVKIKTLDNRVLRVSLEQMVCPGLVVKVPNEGMPKEGGGFGDLFLKFDVVLPEEIIDEKHAEVLLSILPKQ